MPLRLPILFSIMWASCLITQSSHPFGEAMRSYSYFPNFPSGAYLSRGALSLWTVFTIVIPSVSELTVGLVPVGLVVVVLCVTVGLVAVGLVFVVMCVTVGLVLAVVFVAVDLLGVPLMGS